MNRNMKLPYCFLGSAVLVLLNSLIIDCAKLGIFPVSESTEVENIRSKFSMGRD